MSRGVKDLRELINISRLSFYGDDELCKSDENTGHNDEQARLNGPNSLLNIECRSSGCLKSQKDGAREKRNLRNCRFKPLPAIDMSRRPKAVSVKTQTKHNSTATAVSYEKSCNSILQNIECSVVGSWLHRANSSVQWLARWVSTRDYFVQFANFWLAKMDSNKQGELIELEVGNIVDEMGFSVQDGLKEGRVTQEDVMSFFLLVVWEYPSKICRKQNVFILNTLLTLASGQKDEYRKLLSNVKFVTKNPDEIHWILSVRAFALISIVTSLVKFYSSLMGFDLTVEGASDISEICSKTLEDFVFGAVRLGFLDVLVCLIERGDVDISVLKNRDYCSPLFCAVTCGHVEIIRYILKVDVTVDMNEVSKSGNSLLHAAVNTGDPSIVRLLLDAGADVNQVNTECEDTTSLHLAVLQDSSELVQILLDAGASVNDEIGEHTSPLHLAKELQRLDVTEIMKKHLSNKD